MAKQRAELQKKKEMGLVYKLLDSFLAAQSGQGVSSIDDTEKAYKLPANYTIPKEYQDAPATKKEDEPIRVSV